MTLTSFMFDSFTTGWAEPDLFSCVLPSGAVIRATSHNVDLVNPADGFTYYHAKYGYWNRGDIPIEPNVINTCDVTVTADSTIMFPGTSVPMLRVAKLFSRSRVTITTCTIDLQDAYTIIGSVVVFVGRVSAPSMVSTSATLKCSEETYLLAEPWPRRVICAGCPFTLFDAQCALIKDNFAVQCIVGSGSTQTNLALVNPNMLLWSDKFDKSPWVLTNAVLGAHGLISPDGVNNGYVLQRVATNGTEASVTQTLGVLAAGTNLDHAVYAHAGSTGALLALRIIYADATAPTGVVTFDLVAGTIVFTGTTFTAKASITALPGGWYRCAIHAASITTPAANRVDIDVTTSTIGGLGGVAGDFIYIWGAQLEQGTAPTTYATTTTAALVLGSVGTAALPYTKGYIVPTSGQATGWPIMVTLQGDTSHLNIQPFPLPIAVGDTFTMYPGCDGTKAVCIGTFNNLANNGSFPSVPGPSSAVSAVGS